VIGRDQLQIAQFQCAPQRILVLGGAGRRAAHPFGALDAFPVEIGGRQKQVLRAGLGEHLDAATRASRITAAPSRVET